MSEIAIEADNLTKTFPGGQVGVNGLDLKVKRGCVYGLIGRNGAGKTTAIRLLMGLLRADQGTGQILGWNLRDAPREIRAKVAHVSQSQQTPGWMTLAELCRYVSHFYESWDLAFARDLAGKWELKWDRAIAGMSGGEQRKVALLLAFASRPEVVLLDEPVAGLDPIARRQLVDEIIEMLSHREGCTVLFSTHLVGDLERIAEHVGIMDRGRIISSTRLDDLLSTTKKVQVVFDSDEPPSGFSLPGAIWMRVAGPVVTGVVRLMNDGQLEEIRQLRGVRVQSFSMGLEDIFIELLRERMGAASGESACITEESP
jgi:ABC-2 type transport system ATP-binding protein